MSANMIRCIEVKSGKEKFMPEALIKDSKFMRKHGLEVQDIKKLKASKEEVESFKEEMDSKGVEIPEGFLELQEETPLSTEAKKRGRKPKPETEEL